MHVVCAGELDLASAPVLRDVLESYDDDIVVDCAKLTFLDSSAMGVLAGQQARLATSDHSLKLTDLHDIPRRALEIVGLLDALT